MLGAQQKRHSVRSGVKCLRLFIIKGGQAVFIKLVFAKNRNNERQYRCPQLILS